MSDEEPVRCVVEGPVATLTLDRPDRRNAMTTEMVIELHDRLQELRARDDVRVVVLTASGEEFFCPGAYLGGGRGGGEATRRLPEPWHLQVPVLLHDMPQVTLAAINGACAGAGLGWALGCDLRIASSAARFNTAFLAVGVAGDMGVPWSLIRLVGAAKARELFFLKGKFDAAEALRLGIVSDVHPLETFRQEVAAAVERLASAPALALRTMKANFLAAEKMDFGDFVAIESERHLRLVTGPEFAAGIAAFQAAKGANR
ncbi:MAG: enoyl-CoA hydratase/isomerase family protein [Acidimicrobiia bacterium]